MKKTILTAALLCAFLGTQAQEYYEKHVAFPAGATTAQKIDMASRLVPTPQQLAWQQMEFTAFLHFGINTFTGNVWDEKGHCKNGNCNAVNGEMVKKIRPFSILPNWIVNNG